MSDVAVCILADSSLSLASQWHPIVSYIHSMFGRLNEGRSSESFYIGVVTYAAAEYSLTPIIARRYFNLPPFVLKDLTEDVLKIGIGRTGSSSKTGMAALEGYAAALEMFDLFLSSHRSTKEIPQDKQPAETQTGPLCHIIHISACPPDDAQYPSWNQTTILDSLTWKTLPDELRKRSINLNMILVRPNKSFAELHSTVHPESYKAWFKIANESHSVLLSSESSWAPLTVKRQSEGVEPDKPTDTKKTSAPTPKPTPVAPSRVPVPPKSAENDPPPPSTQSNPTSITVNDQTFHRIVAKMRELEPQLKQAQVQINMLQQQGRVQEAENIKKLLAPKMQLYVQCKQILLRVQAQVRNNAAAAATSTSSNLDPTKPGEPKPENSAEPSGSNQQEAAGPSNIPSSQAQQALPQQNVQQVLQAQRQAQAQQFNRADPSTSDVRPPPSMLPQFSPNIAAQMQKLQMKEGITGLSAMSHHQPPQQQPTPNQPGQHAPAQPQNQTPGSNETRAWLGTISCVSPQTMNRMDLQVQMAANKSIQPHLWPSAFEIEFLNHQPVPLPVLREWVNRYGPILCQIRPFPRSVDPQENAFRYKSLATHINERNIYAVGKRAPAGENPKPLMLLLPMGGDGGQLAAAVFPETGVPELPRVNPNPQPVPGVRQPNAGTGQQLLPNMNPQVMAMLQNMSAEQKAIFLNRIRQHQMQQAQAQAQMQAQQAAASGGALNAAAAAVSASLGNLNPNTNPNPLANLPGGGGWPPAGGMPGGQNMPGVQSGIPGGMNANLAQMLAAIQQQRQSGMQPRPGSGAPPPF